MYALIRAIRILTARSYQVQLNRWDSERGYDSAYPQVVVEANDPLEAANVFVQQHLSSVERVGETHLLSENDELVSFDIGQGYTLHVRKN